MKVSIITATYNSELTIDSCLKSIASQSFQNIEHIIIDGKSQDDTLSLVSQYPHIKKVISEKDSGIYEAMNKGITHSSGDIIGILNSDDFYTDSFVLERVSESFYTDGCDAVYGDLQYVDKLNTDNVVRNWKSGRYNRKNYLYGWMPPHPTVFIKRDIYQKFGLFDLNMGSAADYELMLRFMFKEQIKVSYIPTVLVKMRTGGASNASISNRLAANRKDYLAWKKNGLKPYFFTTALKPLRKIIQYF